MDSIHAVVGHTSYGMHMMVSCLPNANAISFFSDGTRAKTPNFHIITILFCTCLTNNSLIMHYANICHVSVFLVKIVSHDEYKKLIKMKLLFQFIIITLLYHLVSSFWADAFINFSNQCELFWSVCRYTKGKCIQVHELRLQFR